MIGKSVARCFVQFRNWGVVQMFRIRKTGTNSSNKEHFHVGGLEIYGDFFFK